MTGLRLLKVLEALLAASDLHGIIAVLLCSLHLSDLTPVDLNDCAWHDLTPLVPEVCHPHLVSDQTSSLALTVLGRRLGKLILRVDLVLKRHKGVALISLSMHSGRGKGIVVEDLGLVQVLITELV